MNPSFRLELTDTLDLNQHLWRPVNSVRRHPVPETPGSLSVFKVFRSAEEPLRTALRGTLDAVSLYNLRKTCRSANNLVVSDPDYMDIARWHPQVHRAMLVMQARYFPYSELVHALNQRRCRLCKREPGTYLYIITCYRVCVPCLNTYLNARPLYLVDRGRPLHPRVENILSKIPNILAVPRVQTAWPIDVSGLPRVRLFDRALVHQWARDNALAVEDPDDPCFSDDSIHSPRKFNSQALICAPAYVSPVRNGISLHEDVTAVG